MDHLQKKILPFQIRGSGKSNENSSNRSSNSSVDSADRQLTLQQALLAQSRALMDIHNRKAGRRVIMLTTFLFQ